MNICKLLCLFFCALPLCAHAWQIKLAEPAGTVLQWNGKALTLGKKTLDRIGQDCEEELDYRLQSVVGPLITLMHSASSYCKEAAHPSHYNNFTTLDARTGKPAKLTDYFDEATLLAALRQDKVLNAALDGKPARTLEEFFANADGECEMYISPKMLQSFAFHHRKGNQIALRIGLPHGCEVERGNFTQIGIYLPIPDKLATWIEQAEQQGRLMGQLSKPKPKR